MSQHPPHNNPHAQSVRCHLLVGGHAFEFDALHFDFRGASGSHVMEGAGVVQTPFSPSANSFSHVHAEVI